MIKTAKIAFGCLLLLTVVLSRPQIAVAEITLNKENKALLTQAEKYLNAVTSLQARFLQVSPAGEYSEGTVFISRPGRMRLEYDPPMQILLVADGTFLIYYDKELDQTSHMFLNSSPAGIMLRENVSFSDKDVTVTKLEHRAGLTEISLVQTEDPESGEITLVFADAPYELKQWRVLDAQGEVTTVSLFEARADVNLPKGLFKIVRPKKNRR